MDDSDENTDLSLVSTDELVHEIRKRSRSSVILTDPKAEEGTFRILIDGKIIGCMGLAAFAIVDM